MKITPVPHDLDLLKSDIVRSDGLHMSAIYNDYYQDAEPERFTRGSLPSAERMSMGFNLEAAMEAGLKSRMADRPGEFRTPEGIAFSPDLIIYNGVPRLGEIKLTWMSSREVPRVKGLNCFPPKFDKWFSQVKCYGHHLEMPDQRLYAFFVNGDYTRHKGKGYVPELLAWDIEFSKREMKDEWDTMLAHARHKKLL